MYKMIYSRVMLENMTTITEPVLKLVRLLSVNEAGHLRELRQRERERGRELGESEEEKKHTVVMQLKNKQTKILQSKFHLILSSPRSQRRVESSPESPHRQAS